MTQVAKEYRTIMYTVERNGQVVVHSFPYNANEKLGMQKLQKFVARGFTFEDPRKGVATGGLPEVLVTRVVDLEKLEAEEVEPEEVFELEVKSEETPSQVLSLATAEERVREDTVKQSKEPDGSSPNLATGDLLLIPCPDCGKRFATGRGVERHMQMHQPGWKGRGKTKNRRKNRMRVKTE